MNRLRTAIPVAAALAFAACAGQSGVPSGPAPAAAGGAAAIRAQAGDTVYLIEHHVRAERREQFEIFVNEVLWPLFERSAATNPARRSILPRLRLLQPATPEADGTWTYAFLLDPVVSGEPYDVLALLRQEYGDEEAVRQYLRFTETWARDFTARPFIQFRSPGR